MTTKALTRCTTRASPRRTSQSPLHLWGACMTVVPKHTRHEMSDALDRTSMERKPGIEPGASTVAWSRSTTELHPLEFARTRRSQMSSGPRGNLLKSRPTHRCMPGRPSVTAGARREGSCEKQKGPDPCWNPGLDVCSSGRVCALTRLPRPVVTANPHNQGKLGLAGSGWTAVPDSSQWLAWQGNPCQQTHSWRARPHDCPSGAERGGGCGQRCSR